MSVQRRVSLAIFVMTDLYGYIVHCRPHCWGLPWFLFLPFTRKFWQFKMLNNKIIMNVSPKFSFMYISFKVTSFIQNCKLNWWNIMYTFLQRFCSLLSHIHIKYLFKGKVRWQNTSRRRVVVILSAIFCWSYNWHKQFTAEVSTTASYKIKFKLKMTDLIMLLICRIIWRIVLFYRVIEIIQAFKNIYCEFENIREAVQYAIPAWIRFKH